jgi:GNAT superfamily N-acetyltransferase
VVRIDFDGAVTALRRDAIRADLQRRGHGRVLLELVERFALKAGCTRLVSFVAPDAVAFYQGFSSCIGKEQAIGRSGRDSVFMAKDVDVPASG